MNHQKKKLNWTIRLPRFKSMKTKLIVFMAALAIIPVIIVGGISIKHVQTTMMLETEDSSLQLAKEVRHSVVNYLSGVEGSINLLAHNVDFTEFSKNPNNRTYGQFLLEDMRNTREDFRNVYFASVDKELLIAPKETELGDYDPTLQNWYKEAIKANGELAISEPYTDKATGKMTLTVSQAVLGKDKAVSGVIAIDLDIDALSNDINQIEIGENGYMLVLSKNGIAITHKDQKLIGTNELSKIKLWKDIAGREEGFSQYEYQGVSKTSAFTTHAKTGWKIVATLDTKEITDSSRGIRHLTLWLMIACGLVSVMVAYFISRKIGRNVQEVKTGFAQASQGDLTTRIHVNSQDEFKELEASFNSMMEGLSQALQNVEVSSKTVLETSSSLSRMTMETSRSVEQVAKAIEEIAVGTVRQAENSQTSADEIAELSGNLERISASTLEMDEASKISAEYGNKGLGQVSLLAEKSGQTKQSTDEVRRRVQDIEKHMGDIHQMLAAISEISTQTNLLSLNASIEAARAGEHGQGFAVVANEVRKLAEQSSASAAEIGKMVAGIQSVVSEAVSAMNRTETVVREQETAVEETKEIFEQIIVSVQTLIDKVHTVKSDVMESDRNRENVVREVESLSSVSQEIASTSEEVSASTEEISATMTEFTKHAAGLQKLSELLDDELKKFKL
ncbi:MULTISPECIES: methyl-accepting chemotaxis protein [Paenibacillus]|uniref:methyl-accepting chemotaxis protein n=1 Tax=Paenibacillus TaxID=44249 RepID=UPI002FE03552